MFASGTRPPSGVNESCQPLIAPQLASVVAVAKRAVLAMPKRTSLPSMLPPGDVSDAAMLAPADASCGFPRASAQYATVTPARNRNAMAAQTAQPCFGEPVIRPSVYVRAEEIAKIPKMARKFVSGVGFSKGCALF